MFTKLNTKTLLISSFQIQGASILIHGFIIKKIKKNTFSGPRTLHQTEGKGTMYSTFLIRLVTS